MNLNLDCSLARAIRREVGIETCLWHAALFVAIKRAPRVLTENPGDPMGAICVRGVEDVPEGELVIRTIEPAWMRA
jgi:hypothetical protein